MRRSARVPDLAPAARLACGLLATLLLLGGAATSHAQSPAPAPSTTTKPATPIPTPPGPFVVIPVGPEPMKEPERLNAKPSGFWTSSRPAEGGAYRWRMLGIGVAIALGMAIFILRTLRRVRRA